MDSQTNEAITQPGTSSYDRCAYTTGILQVYKSDNRHTNKTNNKLN